VVVPLLELDRTALICISTIMNPNNYYSKLLELKDERGEPFFEVHKFVMACEACLEAGTPATCSHMWAQLPPWQSERKHKKIRAMMSDQQELLIRETQGVMSDQHPRAFDGKLITFANKQPPVKPEPTLIEHVIVTIDPSGGGASHFAVVSMYYHRGLAVVCGLESVCARTPQDYKEVLLKHFEMMRASFPAATLVICPEANLGFESSHIARFIEEVKHKVIMYETSSGAPGMITTHDTKEVMWSQFGEKLRERALRFADPVVCTTDAQTVCKMLFTQMRNYSIIIDRPDKMTQHFRPTKRTYSGKMYGNDDLVVMLQFNLLAFRRFFANTKYREWW